MRPKAFAKYLLRYLLVLVTLLILFLLAFLVWVSVSKASLPDKQVIQKVDALPLAPDTFAILSWNLGYASLGDSMDFFYDGGEGVRPNKAYTEKSAQGIIRSLNLQKKPDILLFQEVDTLAKRSWYLPLHQRLSDNYPAYASFFSLNYDAAFVPLPLHDPMGAVQSGLLSLSRYQPAEVVRYALPGEYSWPSRLFMLNRCIQVLRFSLLSGKDLIIVNLHNSAFDANGEQRIQQVLFLQNLLKEEYHKGNYVIAGGDWNQNPPGWNPEAISNGDKAARIEPPLSDSLFMGWTYAYDPEIPSNRFLNSSYVRGTTITSTIDFFLLSPNVELIEVSTGDLGFRHSDHQPVMVRLKLRQE